MSAEHALIGSLMTKSYLFDDVSAKVREADLTEKRNQKLFGAIGGLVFAGELVDPHAVSRAAVGSKSEVEYLKHLAAEYADCNPVGEAADLRAQAIKRATDEAIGATQGLTAELRLRELQKRLGDVETGASGGFEGHAIGEIGVDCYRETVKLHESGRKLVGLTTGFRVLDRTTQGMHPGQLLTIGGRPGHGKTTLALNIAQHCAKAGNKVHFVSLEMSREELGKKMLSAMSGVPFRDIRNGEAVGDELNLRRMGKACSDMHDLDVHIDDRSGLALEDIHAQARLRKRRHGLDLLIVDYLGLIKHPATNMRDRLNDCTKGLKHVAKDLDIPVVQLAQIGRKADDRANGPTMGDGEGSSSIEQDSDSLWFLHDPDPNPNGHYWGGQAELKIVKQRSGELGRILLRAELHKCRFLDMPVGPV